MSSLLTGLPAIHRIVIPLLFLMLWLASLTALGQSQLSNEVRALPPGQTFERELTGAETHRYSFDLKANEFFQVRVEQKGVDVALKLLNANGNVLATMDSPNSKEGPETLSFIAEQPGKFMLELSGFDAKAEKGNYSIRRESSRTATVKDKRRVEVERLFVEAMRARNDEGQSETAFKKFSEVLAGWRELADSYMVGLTAEQLAMIEADYVLDEPKAAKAAHDKALGLLKTGTPESIVAALKQFQEAARLYREGGSKAGEAMVLAEMGLILGKMGEKAEAIRLYEQALKFFRESGHSILQASLLPEVISFYQASGEKQKTIYYLEQALLLYEEFGMKLNVAKTHEAIGMLYFELGEKQKALGHFNQAWPLYKEMGDNRGAGVVLVGISTVYASLGEVRKAVGYMEQALQLFKDGGNTDEVISMLVALGGAYADLDEKDKALNYLNQTLSLYKAGGKTTADSMTMMGLATIYFKLGQNQKAIDYFNQTLSLSEELDYKGGVSTALSSLGEVYLHTGDNQKALNYLSRALLTEAGGIKDVEAITLGRMMYVWSALGNPQAAIFYGKQSVNKYQELRRAIQNFDFQTQKAFLDRIDYVYKKLADILIAEGRLVEAEQVLAMLKDEEVFDYLRRDASEVAKLQRRADLNKREAEALRRYNEISEKVTALGTEFGELQKLQRQGATLNSEQQARFTALASQLEDANRAFQVLLRQIAEEFSRRTNTEKDLQENLALQSDLKSWGEGVVFLYTLVSEDRYRVILVTPNAQVDGKTEIRARDLNRKIAEFRKALRDPHSDPRPLGKEFYDILIRPIEKQLEGAKAKTLLWSLDGNLRLLPLAALWDGKQYFGQKYQNVTVTLASRTRLGEKVEPNWRALGLGVTEAKKVKEPNGTQVFQFDGLPAVRKELLSIIKSDKSPDGVLPGQSLIDAEFNEAAFTSQLLRGYSVVHIASHFNLNPGDSTKSFLLLGDGSVLTVDQIKTKQQLTFEGVELLTLSACQTAVIGKDSSGKEIEGFGYVAQQKGAKAIIATLWSVADESTQLLMSEFYRLIKENPQMTKAAALQLAQQAMIEGKLQSLTAGKVGDTNEVKGGGANGLKYQFDPKRPYAHPFYWSPFILIGNWR